MLWCNQFGEHKLENLEVCGHLYFPSYPEGTKSKMPIREPRRISESQAEARFEQN